MTTLPDLEPAALTYGLKLIAEAIEAHFGKRNEDYDEDVDDTSNQDAWTAFDALVARSTVPEAGKAVDAAEVLSTIKEWELWAGKWAGSAFVADESLPLDAMTDSEHKTELYSGLCKLMSSMMWLHDEVSALASVPAPSGAENVTNKVQHRVRRHKKDEWGPWTDGCVPADYLGWFEQREVPTEIGWRDKRIEILTDECERRSKQISEIAKQRNDAEIRAETAEAEATDLRRKLEDRERIGKMMANAIYNVHQRGLHVNADDMDSLKKCQEAWDRTLSGASE